MSNRQIGWSQEEILLADILKQVQRLATVVGGGGGGSGTVTSVTGTVNRITITGTPTVAPIVDIAATYIGQTSITTLGTITTGVWNGTVVSPVYGGTGVANNVASTLTISGAFATTLTVTGITSLTLPTSGTVATTSNTWLNGSTTTLSAASAVSSAAFARIIFNGTATSNTSLEYHFQIAPTLTFSSNVAHVQGIVNIGGTVNAGVNSQVLRGLVINPVYAYGAFSRASYSQLGLDIRDSSGNGFKFYTDAFTNTNNSFQIVNPSGVTTAEMVVDNSGFSIGTNSGKTISINSGSIFRHLIASSRVVELATVNIDATRNLFGPAWSGTATTSTATQQSANAHFAFQGRGWTGAAAVTTYTYETFTASAATNLLFTSDRRYWNGSTTQDIWRIVNGGSTGLMFLGGITDPTAILHIAAGTTAASQLRLAPGVAPTSPNDGDIYYINTNDRLMFRKNATDAEILSASAVTTEVVVSDTTLTLTYNGVTYKILARA